MLGRDCTPMSTGAILLADIIPSFVIKVLSPFLPYNSSLRVFTSCIASFASFLVVAYASTTETVIFGVVLTSFASGLGEPTFLAHSTRYDKNVVSTWSSGTGGAGVIGAFSYSVLKQIGLSSQQTLLLMLIVPFTELITFFFVLTKANEGSEQENRPLIEDPSIHDQLEPPEHSQLNTFRDKLNYIPKLMIYFVPLSLVYFFEYFINQGLVSNLLAQIAWLTEFSQCQLTVTQSNLAGCA